MKKIILLVRVSTSKQDYEDQTNELIEYAKKDGYTLNDMEIIRDKESASKLSDEDRRGLTKMYAAINAPGNQIECIYCWELSRLSRKPETLWSIHRELLIVKDRVKVKKDTGRINLKVKNPSISLLDDSGQIENSSVTIFGLYVALCQSEISTRVDRTRRTKTSNALKGKYNGGGRIMFGYDVGEGGYYIPKTKLNENENFSESVVVKTIFELYSTGKYGEYKLYRELVARGMDLKRGNIQQILKTKEYTGEKIHARGIFFARQYPAIISRELFDICQKVRRNNITNIDKSKHTYFAAKLIKCSNCGLTMIANKNNAVYRCENKFHVTRERKCNNGDTININVTDSLLWQIACKMEIDAILRFKLKDIEQWKNEIKDLQTKIDNSDKQLETIKMHKMKRYLVDVPDATPEEQLAHAIRATRPDKQRIEQEKIDYQDEIDRLNRLVSEANERYGLDGAAGSLGYLNFAIPKRNNIKQEVENYDDKKRYEIIHKHIKQVSIVKLPKSVKQINITFFTVPPSATYFYAAKIKDRSKRLYRTIKIDYSTLSEAERDFLGDADNFNGIKEINEYFDYSIRFQMKAGK